MFQQAKRKLKVCWTSINKKNWQLSCVLYVQWCRRQRVQAHPQKFWFVENPGKIPENLGNIPENPKKIPKYLGKIPENLGKNGAQRCLTSTNGVPVLQKSSKWRPFIWRSHHKNGRQKLHDNFLGKFGKIWAKILCTRKNLLFPTTMLMCILNSCLS